MIINIFLCEHKEGKCFILCQLRITGSIIRIILAAIAGLLASMFIYEDSDLLSNNLGTKLFTYGQIVVTWHL